MKLIFVFAVAQWTLLVGHQLILGAFLAFILCSGIP